MIRFYEYACHTGNIDYFMVGERVRFLFTSCGESQTNERVFERISLKGFSADLFRRGEKRFWIIVNQHSQIEGTWKLN